jgi:pimeloyl-ACP methyl ester carboxylesterase
MYTNGNGGSTQSYERAVSFTYYIGTALGEFLAGLKRHGFPSKNIHCVGHSLGSQMLGHTGTTYYNKTSEKVARITGIDPAGPCFSNALIDEQIRSGVADYVEVYHCNAGGLGTTAVLADTDFFINRKGKRQPNCEGSVIPGFGEYGSAKCSHKACMRYWALTVHHPNWYLAWSCDSYEHFHDGKCAAHQKTLAGYWNPGNITGVFYASTETYGVV